MNDTVPVTGKKARGLGSLKYTNPKLVKAISSSGGKQVGRGARVDER